MTDETAVLIASCKDAPYLDDYVLNPNKCPLCGGYDRIAEMYRSKNCHCQLCDGVWEPVTKVIGIRLTVATGD